MTKRVLATLSVLAVVAAIPTAASTEWTEREGIRYTVEWENGVQYAVGMTDKAMVKVALGTKPTTARILIVNRSGERIEFHEENVELWLEKKGQAVKAETLTGERWVKKQETKAAWMGALAAFSAGYNAGTYAHSSYDTPDQTVQKYLLRTEARQNADQLMAATRRDFDSATSGLMYSHTMDPGEGHGGSVHFGKPKLKKTDPIRIKIRVGSEVFDFFDSEKWTSR